MKKTVLLLLVLTFVLVALAGFGSLEVNAAADDLTVTIDTGEEITLKDTDGDDYYEISTADELFAFAAAVNGGNNLISAELTKNIDVNPGYVFNHDGTVEYNGSTVTSGWRVWAPIGRTSQTPFKGDFDGHYYTVSGLYVHNVSDTSMTSVATSFIGYVRDGAIVENVGVDNSYFRCDVTEGKSGHSCNAAGLVYHATAQYDIPTIRNCWSMATVYAYAGASGIMTSTTMYTSQETGAIVENCFYGGHISGRNNNVGLGVVGGGVGEGNYQASNLYYNKSKMVADLTRDGGATPVTTEQFESGYVAYHMGGVFGQNVDNGNPVDTHPVFNGPKVYRKGICSAPTYSNTDGVLYHDEDLLDDKCYDENDLCLVCGGLRVVKITDLTIAGTQVVVGGVVQTTTGTGWSYDHAKRTLTFTDGAVITGPNDTYGIHSVGDLNIAVNGTVTVTADSTTIYSEGRLTITLNNNATFNVLPQSSNIGSSGIRSTNDIIISGSGTANVSGAQYAGSSMGIYTTADVMVDGVTLNVKGKGNYYDIDAASLIIGKNKAATVNLITSTTYAMSLTGELSINNGSVLNVVDKTFENTSSVIIAPKVTVADSTIVVGNQTASFWINIFKVDTFTISGSSHIIVRGAASTNNSSVKIFTGAVTVNGDFYHKTSASTDFAYGGTITKIDVSSLEIVTADHLKYVDNGDETHRRECDGCAYAVVVEDSIPCTWSYSASENVMTATCVDCGASSSLKITPHTKLTYCNLPLSVIVVGKIPGVSSGNVVYTQNGEPCGIPTDAGTYVASITHEGVTASLEFTIQRATPKATDFTVDLDSVITFNNEVRTFTVSTANEVYGMGEFTTVIYKDGVAVSEIKDAGEYTIAVKLLEGKNYEAVDELVLKTVTVKPIDLKKEHINVSPQLNVVYNGENQKPEVSVAVDGRTLTLGVDYTMSWTNENDFVNAGTYQLTVVGIGNYSGTAKIIFEIAPKSIDDNDVTIDITEVTYDGNAHVPTITIKDGDKVLVLGTDYSVLWNETGFVNAGTYYADISGAGDYTGSFTRTLVINKAELVIELSSPISSVLPNNQIALNLTVNSTEGTPIWTFTNASLVSGSIIKVDDNLVIGQDEVKVTVTYNETANYKGGSKTITLEVGMPDLTGEIAELEEKIDELNALIEEKADASVVEQKMNEILSKIDALEQVKDAYVGADAALKTELEGAIADAKNEAMTAANTALENAKNELKGLIDSGDAKNASDLADAVQNLNDAIALAQQTAEQFATDADAALKTELEGAISDAKNEAMTAASTALENAKNELKGLIESGDAKNASDLADAVQNLNDAIALAQQTAEQFATDADAVLKAALEASINDAKDLISMIDLRLSSAERAIINLKSAIEQLKQVDKENAEDLEKAIATLNKAIEDAKKIAAESDESISKELTDKINEADRELRKALDELQKNLTDTKEELDGKIEKLNTAVIIVAVVAALGVCGNVALLVWILKRKR